MTKLSAKKLVAINVATLAILGAAGFGSYYFYDQSTNYVKTDNAIIDGKQIVITSPTGGKLTDWQGKLGNEFHTNDTIGQVLTGGTTNGKANSTNITVPTDMEVVSDKGLDNSLVAPGTPLAVGYDFNNLYVTANFDETKINDIAVGQDVDIYVDAFKDTPLKGKVAEIGLTTASTFSLLPSSNSDANYTKVTQVIPVKISIDDAKGDKILPGMNVTVRVHK